jgi:large subunit ribosomal protein L4
MTLSLDLRAVDGAVTGSVTLDEGIFGIQPNVPVLHQVVTAQLAAARSGTQSTKTRAEVSGGGRKPFKQKGTGRARQGSERAPQFTGGGVALGPKPRSYRQRTPRKMIQLALRSALSDRASGNKVVVIDGWPWEAPSTREARSCLEALQLGGKVLVVLGPTDEDAYKSFRNLPAVQLIMASELNAYDILCNDWIVFTRETLPGEVGVVDGEGAEAATGPTDQRPRGEAAEAPPAEDQGAEQLAATAPPADATDTGEPAGEQLEAEPPGDEELAPFEPEGEDQTSGTDAGEREGGDE